MDCHNDLATMLLRKCPQQRSELGNVEFIHGLDGIVKHQPRETRPNGKMKGEE